MVTLIKNLIKYMKYHIVFMSPEDYRDWLEIQEGVIVIYENEKELKKDFPNARIREEQMQ